MRTPIAILFAVVTLLAATTVRGEEIVVSAAASLTNAFREIGTNFEDAHPGDKVVFNFAASGPLLTQIERGAPADVFASADQETMNLAETKSLIVPASRRNFVSNRMVLIVPADSTIAVANLPDLARPEIRRIGIGNPASVPVGRYAREVLTRDKLWETLQPKLINADSVRQVLDYVSRGEVDAGFVYVTDAAIAKERVRIVAEVPTVLPITYPIAVVAGTRHPKIAAAFVDYVAGPAGQAVLARFGFGKP
jgi:molybdate transport system substrate-binding protein